MKTCVIVSGGRLEKQFASEFMNREKPELLIAADKGLAFCKEEGFVPDYIVGDFDSMGEELLPEYEAKGVQIQKYPPVKDATDTEIALRLAIEKGAKRITILGATQGSRLDHLFGNVHILTIAMTAGVECFLQDAHNRVRILQNRLTIKRNEQYGKYISFLPLTTEAAGVTLKGFRYPLEKFRLHVVDNPSLGISNELSEEEGRICIEKGILLMIESKD